MGKTQAAARQQAGCVALATQQGRCLPLSPPAARRKAGPAPSRSHRPRMSGALLPAAARRALLLLPVWGGRDRRTAVWGGHVAFHLSATTPRDTRGSDAPRSAAPQKCALEYLVPAFFLQRAAAAWWRCTDHSGRIRGHTAARKSAGSGCRRRGRLCRGSAALVRPAAGGPGMVQGATRSNRERLHRRGALKTTRRPSVHSPEGGQRGSAQALEGCWGAAGSARFVVLHGESGCGPASGGSGRAASRCVDGGGRPSLAAVARRQTAGRRPLVAGCGGDRGLAWSPAGRHRAAAGGQGVLSSGRRRRVELVRLAPGNVDEKTLGQHCWAWREAGGATGRPWRGPEQMRCGSSTIGADGSCTHAPGCVDDLPEAQPRAEGPGEP